MCSICINIMVPARTSFLLALKLHTPDKLFNGDNNVSHYLIQIPDRCVCDTPHWSLDHTNDSVGVVFCFGYSSEEGSFGFLPPQRNSHWICRGLLANHQYQRDYLLNPSPSRLAAHHLLCHLHHPRDVILEKGVDLVELVSTQTFISLPFMHQSSLTGSDSHTLAIVSVSIWQREAFLTSSSQFLVSALAWHLINAVATLSQPHTEKWPTSFPHRENVPTGYYVGDFWNLTCPFPSEGVILFPDLQTQNLGPVSQSLGIITD